MRAVAQPPERVRVHHRRGDPRDHVGAERLLLVQHRAHRGRLARLEVEQVRDDGRRAEVEREREPARGRVARLDLDQLVVAEDGGHLPVGVAERPAEPAHELERGAQLEVVHRGEHAVEIRGLVLERRLGQLEVALLHGGTEDHVAPDSGERRLRPRLQRRHLDDHVLARLGPAGEPPARLQLVGLERARVDRRDPDRARRDPHLALLAGAVAAAGRVDRDGVPARRVEERRPRRHARLLAWRRPPARTRSRTRSGCWERSASRMRLRQRSRRRRGRLRIAIALDPARRPTRRARASGRSRAPRRRTAASARP